MKKEDLEKCVRDIKKIMKADSILNELEFVKEKISKETQENNLTIYLDYLVKNNILKNLEDYLELTTQLPELITFLAKYLKSDLAIKKILCITQTIHQEVNYYRGGTYNRLEDAPGYRTEWNERCIPDNIHISSKNSRCNSRC